MYFDQCKTREDLKKTYKDLCMKHHPDLGGDLETMKEINAEFDKVYRILKDVHHAGIEEDWDIQYCRKARTDGKEQEMTTITACKSIIRAYIENSGFEVRDENALDEAARELRDMCDEHGTDPDGIDADEFCAIVEKYDI